MRQEGVTAVNNADFPSNFLVLTKRTKASLNEIAIPRKNHFFPFGCFIFILSYVEGKPFFKRLRG